MILLQISDGTTTLHLCDIDSRLIGGKENTGYELDGQFYTPAITNQTNINLGLNGNFGSINQSYIRIRRKIVKDLTKDELTAAIWLWDEKSTSSKFKVFSGVIALREKNSLEYTYQVRQTNGGLDADLLTAAPDFEQVFYSYSVDTATSGTNTITVGEDISPPQSSGTLTIGGDTYSYTSFGSSVFTLSSNLTETYTDDLLIVNNTKTYDEERVYPYMFGYLRNTTLLVLAATCVSGCGGAHYSDGETTALQDGGQDVNYTQIGTTVTKTGTAPVYEITADVDATSGSAGSATTETDTKPNQPITNENFQNTVEVSGTNYLAYVTDTTSNVAFSLDEDGNAVFGGNLSAAGGTFSGELVAAGGRFLGDVSFLNDSGTYYSKSILLKSFPDGNSLPVGGLISYPTKFSPYNSTSSTDNRFSSASDNLVILTTTGKSITVGSKEYQLAFSIVKTGSANPIDYEIEIIGYQSLNRTTTGLYSFTCGAEFYINFLTSQSIEVYVPKAWYLDFSGNQQVTFYMYDNNSVGTFTTTEYGINFMAVNE